MVRWETLLVVASNVLGEVLISRLGESQLCLTDYTRLPSPGTCCHQLPSCLAFAGDEMGELQEKEGLGTRGC